MKYAPHSAFDSNHTLSLQRLAMQAKAGKVARWLVTESSQLQSPTSVMPHRKVARVNASRVHLNLDVNKSALFKLSANKK